MVRCRLWDHEVRILLIFNESIDMPDNVEVDPEMLRRAATAMGNIRDTVQNIVDDADSALSVGSSAWGNDGLGDGFAEGPAGFRAASGNVTDGTQQMADVLDRVSADQDRAATLLEGADTDSAERFRSPSP